MAPRGADRHVARRPELTASAPAPVLQIASNQFSEELGAHLVERASEAFASHGLTIVRCFELVLELDGQSEQLLRAHGQRLADLSIQRETTLRESCGGAARERRCSRAASRSRPLVPSR